MEGFLVIMKSSPIILQQKFFPSCLDFPSSDFSEKHPEADFEPEEPEEISGFAGEGRRLRRVWLVFGSFFSFFFLRISGLVWKCFFMKNI